MSAAPCFQSEHVSMGLANGASVWSREAWVVEGEDEGRRGERMSYRYGVGGEGGRLLDFIQAQPARGVCVRGQGLSACVLADSSASLCNACSASQIAGACRRSLCAGDRSR